MARMLAVSYRGLAALGLLVASEAALAHAVLMDSSPKAGEMLATTPSEVSVTFNESVGPVFFRILDRQGKEVGRPGEIQLDGTRMIMPLGDTLANGTYVLTYRVISADTHPVGTTFAFAVGEPVADTSAMAQGADQGKTAWTIAVGGNRWILYAAMLLAAGSALFVLLLAAPVAVVAAGFSLGRIAAIVAAIAYLLAIGFGGAEMVLASGSGLFSGSTWARGLSSTLTPSAAIGVPAMLLLLWAYRSNPSDPRRGALAIGAAAAIASFLVTGHAATAAPVWLMATTVGVHLTCTAFWIGSLYPLYRSTTVCSTRESGALMTQFSVRAAYAVGAIALSGLVISWVQLGSLGQLFETDYGAVLTNKIILFLVVLAIAAHNKLGLTPALERGEETATRRIRRTILIEYAVFIFILGAAMAMTLSVPPRALAAQSGAAAPGMAMSEGVKWAVSSQGYGVDLELSPARAGENMLMATFRDSAGQVLTGIVDVEVVGSLDSAGISEIRVKAQNLGNGMWHAMFTDMIIPGEWSLTVEAFVTDYDKVRFETKANVQ